MKEIARQTQTSNSGQVHAGSSLKLDKKEIKTEKKKGQEIDAEKCCKNKAIYPEKQADCKQSLSLTKTSNLITKNKQKKVVEKSSERGIKKVGQSSVKRETESRGLKTSKTDGKKLEARQVAISNKIRHKFFGKSKVEKLEDTVIDDNTKADDNNCDNNRNVMLSENNNILSVCDNISDEELSNFDSNQEANFHLWIHNSRDVDLFSTAQFSNDEINIETDKETPQPEQEPLPNSKNGLATTPLNQPKINPLSNSTKQPIDMSNTNTKTDANFLQETKHFTKIPPSLNSKSEAQNITEQKSSFQNERNFRKINRKEGSYREGEFMNNEIRVQERREDVTSSVNYKESVNPNIVFIERGDDKCSDQDNDSLFGDPHYAAISNYNNNKGDACREQQETRQTNGSHSETSNAAIRKQDSERNVEFVKIEDDYAIPIPKSLRKIGARQPETTSTKEGKKETINFAYVKLPVKPPRSPNVTTRLHKAGQIEDGDGSEPSSSSTKVKVSCEIKKMSTDDDHNSLQDDYDYSNIPKYGRYDFLSLGRRPKIMRALSAKDGKRIPVNLEMMLRHRRQSLTDIATSTVESLNVEDILKSCNDYYQSNVYYRNRTSSDSTHNTSWYASSVLGAPNFHSRIQSVEERAKYQEQSESPSITSVLKQNNTGKQRSILKSNKEHEPGTTFHTRAINFRDTPQNSGNYSNKDVIKSCGNTENRGNSVHSVSFSSPETVLIGQNDLEWTNQEHALKSPKVTFIGQDDIKLTNQNPDIQEINEFPFIDETENSKTPNSAEGRFPILNSDSKRDNSTFTVLTVTYSQTKDEKHHILNKNKYSDYDSLENDNVQGKFSLKPLLPEHSRNCSQDLESSAQKMEHGINSPSVSSEHFLHHSDKNAQKHMPISPSVAQQQNVTKFTIEVKNSQTEKSNKIPTSSLLTKTSASSQESSTSKEDSTSQTHPLQRQPILQSTGQQLNLEQAKSAKSGSVCSSIEPQRAQTSQPISSPVPLQQTTSAKSGTVHSSLEPERTSTSQPISSPVPLHQTTSAKSGIVHSSLEPQRTPSSQPTSPPISLQRAASLKQSTSTSYPSSDLQSPSNLNLSGSLSPGSVFSDSADSSSALMEPLSVDVFTDESVGNGQTPTEHSPTYIAQLEASEVLKWLRAAGFPQYAQMFVDGQFPVDISLIEKDHEFLDRDSLKSLFRRLQKLNKHARLSKDTFSSKKIDDDDDECVCALSDRWEYETSARRWSRKDVSTSSTQTSTMGSDPYDDPSRSGSKDCLLDHSVNDSDEKRNRKSNQKTPQHPVAGTKDNSLSKETTSRSPEKPNSSLKTQQSSQSIDKAKSSKGFFRKMEGIKPKKSSGLSKRSKIKEISEPIVEDTDYMRAKLERLNCVDISQNSTTFNSSSVLYQSLRRSKKEINNSSESAEISSTNQISQNNQSTTASGNSQSSTLPRSKQSYGHCQNGMTSNILKTECHNVRSNNADYSIVQPNINSNIKDTRNVRQNSGSDVANVHRGNDDTNVHRGNGVAIIQSDFNLKKVAQNAKTPQSGSTLSFPSNGYTEQANHYTVIRSNNEKSSLQHPTLTTENKSESLTMNPQRSRSQTHRKSIYDNMLPTDFNPDEEEAKLIFPGIYQVIKKDENKPRDGNIELSNDRGGSDDKRIKFFRGINSENNWINSSQAPNSNYLRVLNSNSSQTPNSNFSQTPSSNFSQAPSSNSSQTPNSNFSQTPSSDFPQTPDSNSFQTPSSTIKKSFGQTKIQFLGRVTNSETSKQSKNENSHFNDARVTSIDSQQNIRLHSEALSPQFRGVIHTSTPRQALKSSTPGSEADTSSIDSQTNTRSSPESFRPQFNGTFYTSSPLDSSKGVTLLSETDISSIDSRNSSTRISLHESPGKPKSIIHSNSADSYFKDNNNNNNSREDSSFGGSRKREGGTPRPQLRREYEDLDIILGQLYHNIDELTNFMGKEQPGPTKSLPKRNNTLGMYGVAASDTETSLSGGECSTTTTSSAEDPEFVLTDVSRDSSLDHLAEVRRERKDSGVGHSLPRSTRQRQRKKIRWHSFQNSHRPAISNRDMQINSLSICQMVRLQKLALLKLTAIMEKCLPVSRSGWNWMMPKFLKKQKITDFGDKKVFGVPFSIITQRTGQPFPQCILYAMRYIRRNCPNAVGIFRKSGVKSKIQQLRDDLDNDPDSVDFEGMNPYNVADMLKTYFRDLPECLLTNKMSDVFRSIYIHVPPAQRLEAIQTAIVLLPDENREVLESVLLFLSDVASYEADHQMNASNLAMCFAPTVFQLGPQQVAPPSPKRNNKNAPVIQDPFEILEQKAAHDCLLMMILECKKLFTVMPSLYQQVRCVSTIPLQDIENSLFDVRAFGQERIQIVLKEAHDKHRGWLQILTDSDIEVYNRKPLDDCPLREWKLSVEIDAPPIEVLHRIMQERHVWDEDLVNWSVVEQIDGHSDVFQFVVNSMAPHPCRQFCVLRYWRSDLYKGACAIVTMSIDHPDAAEVQGVPATDLGSYFLMEPCGSGRSLLTYITRMDTRGRGPDWYTRIFGHFCANFLERLRDSFKQISSGPETKV